jgi:hypothetical protein
MLSTTHGGEGDEGGVNDGVRPAQENLEKFFADRYLDGTARLAQW